VPKTLDVHLVMDNYGTHKTPTVKRWLARNPRLHVHFAPTSASWLNQVERWLATLAERQIRRGTHRSTVELERAIRDYLSVNNRDPKPFGLTKTADQILESIKRFCMRTSNSGHQGSSAQVNYVESLRVDAFSGRSSRTHLLGSAGATPSATRLALIAGSG